MSGAGSTSMSLEIRVASGFNGGVLGWTAGGGNELISWVEADSNGATVSVSTGSRSVSMQLEGAAILKSST